MEKFLDLWHVGCCLDEALQIMSNSVKKAIVTVDGYGTGFLPDTKTYPKEMLHKTKITVMHIITGLGLGGAERMLSNVVLAMDPNKYCNIVVSLKDLGHWGPILQERDIQVYQLNMCPNIYTLGKLFSLYRIIRKHRPDFIQGWMYHANIIASLIGRAAGVKNIYWNIRCSMMDLSKYRITTTIVFKIGALLAKSPTKIINNSRSSIQQHIENGYNSTEWNYIPNGFDLQKFKPCENLYKNFRSAHNLADDAILIGIVARFDAMKDHVSFLQAAAILAKENPRVYFVCAGDNVNCKNEKINNIVLANTLESRVLLLGQVTNVHELLPALDYLTQTSIGEGFPNVVAEAMSCGVECIVTDVGESLEIIGPTGFQIPLRDPIKLAATWRAVLLRDSNTIPQKRIEVRQRIESNFSINRIAAIYSAQYDL